mmetsp:Transcript_39773/g.49164  ORF Transcript_39773/g.49164 Transcript_39773/m.49164 type:complete len:158 (-) Transcript_39773:14-487(-)
MSLIPLTAKEIWPITNIVLPGWILLAIKPTMTLTKIVNIIISIIISFTYGAIIIDSIINPPPNAPPMDFFTMEGVVALFKQGTNMGILAAWLHYCVFDLWVGQWISIDFSKNIKFTIFTKIYHIISLFFCMMLGPVGLLIYLFGKYVILPPSKSKKD